MVANPLLARDGSSPPVHGNIGPGADAQRVPWTTPPTKPTRNSKRCAQRPRNRRFR